MTTTSRRTELRASVGLAIRTYRRQRGLTIDELNRAVGCSPNSNVVGQWERGEHLPRLDNLYALADALGVSVYDLLPEKL